MESYIVRIYRRDPENADSAVGTIEFVEHQVSRPFHSLETLRSMMRAPAAAVARSSDSRLESAAEVTGPPTRSPITERCDH